MSMRSKPRTYAWLAEVVFVLQIALTGVLVESGRAWMGFGESAAWGLSIVWAGVWLAAVVGMLMHRRWGGGFAIAGALVSLMHGLVIVAAGGQVGILYMAFGVGLLFLMKRALPWFGWHVFADTAVAR
jgi:hypothetical protein